MAAARPQCMDGTASTVCGESSRLVRRHDDRVVRLLYFGACRSPSLKFYPPGMTRSLTSRTWRVCSGFWVRPFERFSRTNRRSCRAQVRVPGDAVHYGRCDGSDRILPTYQTAKWFAPITLIVIRVLQGSTWRRIRRSGGLRCGARS